MNRHRKNYGKGQNRFSDEYSVNKNNYVPYTTGEVEKNIRYFGSTCKEYEYSSALSKYLYLLRKYRMGNLRNAPKYPRFSDHQTRTSSEYKRPGRYQNVSGTQNYKRTLKEKPNKTLNETLEEQTSESQNENQENFNYEIIENNSEIIK